MEQAPPAATGVLTAEGLPGIDPAALAVMEGMEQQLAQNEAV